MCYIKASPKDVLLVLAVILFTAFLYLHFTAPDVIFIGNKSCEKYDVMSNRIDTLERQGYTVKKIEDPEVKNTVTYLRGMRIDGPVSIKTLLIYLNRHH